MNWVEIVSNLDILRPHNLSPARAQSSYGPQALPGGGESSRRVTLSSLQG